MKRTILIEVDDDLENPIVITGGEVVNGVLEQREDMHPGTFVVILTEALGASIRIAEEMESYPVGKAMELSINRLQDIYVDERGKVTLQG